MNIITIYILIAILGLIIGSFLNVVILRFDEIKTIINTRSHCMKCKREIPWYDLVPFFSYILLNGKCRYCKETISFQYPIVEIGTALIFVLLYWHFGVAWILLPLSIISCLLIVIFVYDILHLMIPDILVWLSIGVWIVWIVINYFTIRDMRYAVLPSIYGGLALGGFLAILVLLSKEKWMGAGDIGLGFLLGALMGWPNVLVGTFAAFILGSIIGLFLIATKTKKLKDAVPFAPFLILGTYIAIFWGNKIVEWYLGGIFG